MIVCQWLRQELQQTVDVRKLLASCDIPKLLVANAGFGMAYWVVGLGLDCLKEGVEK